MKWLFEDLVEKISFEETVDYPELVDMRYELISLEPIKVAGEIMFQHMEGFVTLKLTIDAMILAANTAEPIRFNETIETGDVISENETIIIDVENETIDISPYVKECIDLFLPSYVVDESNTVPSTKGSEWNFLTEEQYMETLKDGPTENKFANLSQLLNEKNKD